MGYFAVVRCADKVEQTFEIPTCHLNFWSVRGVFTRILFWDVGLHLKVGDKDLTEFKLALPFLTAQGGLEDLYDLVIKEKVARLLFGRDVYVHEPQITFGPLGQQTVFAAHKVSEGNSVLDNALSGTNRSVWTIKPTAPIEKNTNAYIRLRFRVLNSGRTFSRTALRHGRVLDLRIADIREAVEVEKWRDLHDNVCPIQRLYVFAILPAALVLRGTSPALHYTRLGEGTVWNEYLGRPTDRSLAEKMVVYQWRNLPKDGNAKPVTTNDPFQVYLAVSQEPPGLTTGRWILLVVTVFLATLCAILVASELPTILEWISRQVDPLVILLKTRWKQFIAGLTVTAIVTLVLKVVKIPGKLASIWRTLVRWHNSLQVWWFRR